MKMTKILSLVLALLMLSLCFVGCGEKTPDATTTKKPQRGPNDIVLWVSTTVGVDAFMADQVAAFIEEHPEYAKYNIIVETVGEGDAAGEVLKDVASGPDVYCFAQDQIARLVQGGALAPLGVQASEKVTEENDAGSVNAATVGGSIYAYPMTSDNGYFLFYDSSIVSDQEAQTLEGIIAACESAGKKFAYNSTNGWYTAAFFFSYPVGGSEPLCTSTWTYSTDGKVITGLTDTLNSNNGLIAMKGMRKLTSNAAVHFDADKKFTTDVAAAINGIWAVGELQGIFADGKMKATKLPTFTVDGQEYQMGSFSGYKLMGCKPQTDPERGKFCTELAQYLTSKEAQLERYYEFQWGPSNKEAQQNQNVMNNKNLQALYAQMPYAQMQGAIASGWWDEMKALGTLNAKANVTEDDIWAALATYEQKVKAMVAK